MLEDKEWFSSHGESMKWYEFIDLEVTDRGNYTLEEIDDWCQKYDIAPIDQVIWVTNNLRCIGLYCEYLDHPIKMNVKLIITESDDGSDGYLAVL